MTGTNMMEQWRESRMQDDFLELRTSTALIQSGGVFQRQTEMKIKAVERVRPERQKEYKGRITTWPGLLLLFTLLGSAIVLIVYGAAKTHENSEIRFRQFIEAEEIRRGIKDNLTDDGGDLVSVDGQRRNPIEYPPSQCYLPDYQAKDGKIFAVGPDGKEIPVGIKGVNWFGMETGVALPFGLWENPYNGTTAYEIAAFLARNKFNSVRLPVCIENILKNTPPIDGLINKAANRAIDVQNYMSTLKSIIKALGFRQISVMISLHTLTTKTSGGIWYDESLGISEADFFKAVDRLTKNLCNDEYWNVIGLDLKNESHKCTWGTGAADDFVIGSERIANRMLKGCRNWLGFVEGINTAHTVNIDGEAISYYDWWGGGLQGAATVQPKFSVENKLVYAPHYYTSAVAPQPYFYGGGTGGPGGIIENYIELDDETLFRRIDGTIMDMFGFLGKGKKNVLVLGEFAGIYAKDAHPKKTVQRSTDFTIDIMVREGWAGGYMWSLNPESKYDFNPADRKGIFTEGLLLDDWLSPDVKFLKSMAGMDKVPNLKKFPCFQKTSKNKKLR